LRGRGLRQVRRVAGCIPELVTKAGVALIFFCTACCCRLARCRAGALNWRLHALVQSCTFLFFSGARDSRFTPTLGRSVSPELKLGLVFSVPWPSTVSSSVAMTATARGNVAGAVFNATLSSLIGVFLTRLDCVVLKTSGQTQPIGAGHPRSAALARAGRCGRGRRCIRGSASSRAETKRRSTCRPRDDSAARLQRLLRFVKQGIWTGHARGQLWLCSPLRWRCFGSRCGDVARLGRAAFNREANRAMFCGSKKPWPGRAIGEVDLRRASRLGLILLPIMIYHPCSL